MASNCGGVTGCSLDWPRHAKAGGLAINKGSPAFVIVRWVGPPWGPGEAPRSPYITLWYNWKKKMMQRLASDTRRSTAPSVLRQLAWVRYELRRSLRFSEKAARACGVTPQQHQLLLGIAGYTGRGWATISELAEFLQQRQNAVVGLVERARTAKTGPQRTRCPRPSLCSGVPDVSGPKGP